MEMTISRIHFSTRANLSQGKQCTVIGYQGTNVWRYRSVYTFVFRNLLVIALRSLLPFINLVA